LKQTLKQYLGLVLLGKCAFWVVVSTRSLQDGFDMLAPVALTFASTVEAGGWWLRLWDARVSAVFCGGASNVEARFFEGPKQ
jgi:hypothetical protein